MVTSLDFTTKLNNLDTLLTNKLNPIKDLLKEYSTDPIKQYSLSEHDKQTIATLRKYAPSLFKETNILQESTKGMIGAGVQPIVNTTESAKSALTNKVAQAEVTGLQPQGTLKKLMDEGVLPDIQNKNIWGRIAESQKYPLQKLLSGLQAIPRGYESYISDTVKNITADKKITKDEVLKSLLPAGTSKAFWQGLVNKKGSEYENYSGAKMFKDLFPDTKFTKQYEFTKDTNDWVKGTNWLQKLITGIAGSPADIAGLGADILLDPLTYISGGLGKGASVATTLEKDLAEAGLKAGSKLALKPLGKKIVNEFIEEGGDELIKRFAKETAKMTEDQAARFIERKVTEEAISKALKSGVTTADKIIDYGGMKMFGQTVIKGADFEQFAPLKAILNPAKLNEIPVLRTLNKAFNPFAGMPDEFRPLKAYVDSKAQARMAEELKNIQPIVKNLSDIEQETLSKYASITRDIEKMSGKVTKAEQALNDLTGTIDELSPYASDMTWNKAAMNKNKWTANTNANKLSKLQDELAKLDITPKIEEAYKKMRTWFDDLYAKEIKYVDVKNLEKYYPARYVNETKKPFKSSFLGKEKAAFELPQTTDYLTALEKGAKPKDLIDTLTGRAWESVQREYRYNLTNEVKQFGQLATDKIPEGYTILRDIPELKGWALPKEYGDVLSKTYNQFFGDEATKNIAKVYDRMQTIWKRWALATPGYHFRNFFSDNFSGLMQYGLDWSNPKDWQDGINLLRGKNIELTSATGKKITVNKDMFTNAGITNATQYKIESELGKMNKAFGLISPAEWSMKGGNLRENLGRAVAGIKELKSGNNLVNAAFNVKKVFFDYSSLTPFEKNWMKRIYPFYTWLRKNLERQFELLGKRTGAYAAIPKAMNYIENVADTVLGGTEEYNQIKPDYYKDLGMIRTAITDYSGNALAFNPNLPFQDWSKTNIKDMLSSLSPMIKIPIELGFNKDIFFGTDIVTGKNYQEAPKYMNFLKALPNEVLKIIGAKKDENGQVYISDRTAYAVRQIPALYSLSRMLPATEQAKTPFDWLSVLGGVKFTPIETEKLKESKYKNLTAQLNDLISSEKATGNEIPDMDKIESALKSIYTQDVSQKTGYDTIEQLSKMMDIYGGSSEEKLLIKLLKQPYEEEMSKLKNQDLSGIMAILEQMGIKPTKDNILEAIKQLEASKQ